MSWEEVYRRRYPCPCGHGEYEEIGRSDDWGRFETSYAMLCPACKALYVYDGRMTGGHPGDEHCRGWIEKSVIEAEGRYRAGVTERAHALYDGIWKHRLAAAGTKKRLWEIYTVNGRYYPSLATFYQHNKHRTLAQSREAARSFGFNDIQRIIDSCEIDPDWDLLGVVRGDTCEMCGGNMYRSNVGIVCSKCKYIRPDINGF